MQISPSRIGIFLLSACDVSATLLGTGDTGMNKVLALKDFVC